LVGRLADRIIVDFQAYFRQLKKRAIDAIVDDCLEEKRCNDYGKMMKVRKVKEVKFRMTKVISRLTNIIQLLGNLDSEAK
jgi:hypothetical protein